MQYFSQIQSFMHFIVEIFINSNIDIYLLKECSDRNDLKFET